MRGEVKDSNACMNGFSSYIFSDLDLLIHYFSSSVHSPVSCRRCICCVKGLLVTLTISNGDGWLKQARLIIIN